MQAGRRRVCFAAKGATIEAIGSGAWLLLEAGLGNLAAYLAAHVLLCLLPAFLIAGGLSALVPKDSITRLLGRKASKVVAYPSAVMAGSVLAVCSCTIVPLFAGIYSKGFHRVSRDL